MAAANALITMKEALTLPSVGIHQQFITFTHVTMESEKYICVRETYPQNIVVIIDMSMPMQPLRRPIAADSALMNPNSRILALKAQLSGTTQDHLQIFNIELKAKIKSHQMPEKVVFWKWITPKTLGLVTQTSVYHWSIEGDSEPAKMFDRTANLSINQIINYRCDPSEKWLVLIGIAPGAPERPQLVKGNMQLFSVDQQRSHAFEAHAASFASFKVAGNENPSTLICFASKTTNAGQITSKLNVIELGAQPGKPSFAKKQADLFIPPDFADDFPVAMQISQKYGLIYVITKFGQLFVYDLETATAVYRNRISLHPIFLTTEASGIGGFYAVNRRGQVLLATVNEATIVPFVSGQLNNLELAANLAKRGNLPGAENLPKIENSQPTTGRIGSTSQKPSVDSKIQPLQPSNDNYKEKKKFENSQPRIGRIGSTSQRPSVDTRERPSFKPYSEEEIRAATNDFTKSSIIGEGGYGAVYKCKLDNWDVAVKILAEKSDQGLVEYIKEMGVLSRMRHENLVHLMGTCFELRALVYEYIPNGSLEKCLVERPTELMWQLRTRIVYEICKGIMYLHARQPQPLVHGDLKPHNVLLDDGFRVKLADFGLCRALTQGQASKAHHVTVHISGSAGYMDPDYIGTGRVTPGVDVYALGKTVVRILTGQQPPDVFPQVHAACKRGPLMAIVDPTVRDWPENVVKVLARFALRSCKFDRYSSEFMRNFYSDLGKILDDIDH